MADGVDRAFEDGRRWYVVQTQPVREYLARDKLVEQGFDIYLPQCLERRHVRRPGGSIVIKQEQPLFPRYCFARFDLATTEWRAIEDTMGVSRLLAIGDRPLPIRAGVVEKLQARIEAAGGFALLRRDGRPSAGFRENQRVRVNCGAFEGFEGLFQRESGERVFVLLDFLGGVRTIPFAVSAVDPA